MKRILIEIAAALLLIAGSGAVRAGEGAEVEAGIKMWLNDWRQTAPGAGTITSDSTMLLGPAIEVTFPHHVFVEASYLFSTADYKFSEVIGPAKYERQDADFALGYMVIPEFGVLTGYKSATFRQRAAGTKATVSGPLVGMRLYLPVDQAFSFYVKLNYLFTTFNEDDAVVSLREDSPGWTFEFGARYAFTRVFSGRLGYKYETNTGKDSDTKDSFSGLTFGGMVSF